ncbi:MAG: response regulator [Legionella sp.]|nr:response regulator [Legionella sp.]
MNTKANKQELKQPSALPNIYEDAFHFTEGYAYLLDKHCALVDCNNNFLKLLKLNSLPEKNIGSLYKMMSEHGLWSEEQVQLIKKNDINAILNAEPQIKVPDLPVVDSNGEVINYQSSRIPLTNKADEVYGLLVIFNDVTDQIQLSEQFDLVKKQLQVQNASPDKGTTNDLSSKKWTKPPKILIVEDNAIAQKAAQSILMNNDCLVEIADNEAKFHALFEPGKYDLVFMDIGLENTSGYVMAKQLRAKEKDSGHHVPIIALTGYEADTVRLDCDYYQMEGVITKPLTAEQVKQIIQHYIFHINLEITGFKTGKAG